MKKLKRILAWTGVVLATIIFLSGLGVAARGPIGWRDLNVQTSTRRMTVPLIPAAVPVANSSSQTTIGLAGVISSQAPGTGVDTGSHLVQTTTIAGFAWPQQLFISIADANGSDTYTCASVDIWGYDQFHNAKMETVLTIAEAGEYTNTVWERVTRVEAEGCLAADGVPGAGDAVVITATNTHLGFGFVIKDEYDFVSVCLTNLNDTAASSTMECLALNDGTATDVQSAIVITKTCGPGADERCSYFNTLADATLFQGTTIASGDQLHVTVRPRF